MSDAFEALSAALADRYRLEKAAGHGGMATVYLANDLRHDRQVAVKVLREELGASTGGSRFLNEIRIAAGLQHPNIAPLFDSGTAAGLLYYVMPFLSGPSLRERLTDGAPPLSDVIRWLRDIADALSAAHAAGIVHRDLKPENVMLSGRHALVTDFGVAKALSAAGEGSLTTAGIALGTPTYMAPEQATADVHIDHRADLYAFGVMAYELLTGKPPFVAPTARQLLMAHLTVTPERVEALRPDLPAPLAALVMQCLAKEPGDRPASAEAILEAFDRFAVPTGGTTPMATRPVRRPMAWQRMAAVAAVVVIGVAAWWGLRGAWSDAASAASVSAEAGPSDKSVAVLPFTEVNAPAGEEYFADGLTDEVITSLSAIPGLRVPGRTSAMRFKGSTAPPAAVADTLKVRLLLTGTVQRAGGRVRVRAQLVQASDGYQAWAGTIDRPASDVFAIYDSVSRAIAGALTLQFASAAPDRAGRRVVNAAAYPLYLKGKAFLNDRKIDSAIALLRQSLVVDSSSADTWAALALAHTLSARANGYSTVDGPRAARESRVALARAFQLDSLNADAWAAEGRLAHEEFRYADARRAFARSLAISRSNAQVLLWSAQLLLLSGDSAEALVQVREAERIDPLSFIVGLWAAQVKWFTGNREEAYAAMDALVRLYPTNSRVLRDAGLFRARRRDWNGMAELVERWYAMRSGDSARARTIADDIRNPARRIQGVRTIAESTQDGASTLATRWIDALWAAGDSAAVRAGLAKETPEPWDNGITVLYYLGDPGLRASPEYARFLRLLADRSTRQ